MVNEGSWIPILLFGLAGVIFSLYSPTLMPKQVAKKDTRLFGKIPFWLIGTVGYALIATTAAFGYGTKIWPDTLVVLNHSLIVFAFLFSSYLGVKSIRMDPVICEIWIIPWIGNMILLMVTRFLYH